MERLSSDHLPETAWLGATRRHDKDTVPELWTLVRHQRRKNMSDLPGGPEWRRP